MTKRIPLVLLLLAAAAAAYYLVPRWLEKPAEAKDVLLLSGNIEAHESLLSFKVQGRIVELPVEEGQWVEEGQLLARLDAADFRQQVALDEAALRVRESELALAIAGSRRQEIEAAEQVLLDAEADLKQKQLDFERAQNLFKEEVISAQARDLAETALKRAQAARENARQRLDAIREGTRQEEIAVARANVVQARERRQLSRVNFDYTELRAPRPGVITVRQAELGEVMTPGSPVVTLADLEHVWMRAYVPETDLGRIRWGQPARLRTDTYPGKDYAGRISFIADKAEFTPKSIQTYKERVTLVYRIKIDVQNANHELKPGMPADAVIDLKQQ